MNTYIYNAELYCDECGNEIREHLTNKGFAPSEPLNEETYDSDDYPKGPYPDGGGESDCPQHCGNCRIHLENPLTSEGVEYVRERLNDRTRGDKTVLNIWQDFYSDVL